MQTFRKTPQQDSNGLIIHVSSFNDRSTEVVTRDRIRVGTTDDCEVKVRLSQDPAIPTNGPVIELVRLNGIYRIDSFNPALEVKLNGRPIKANKGIYDGDEIWIGPSGPSIHFFPIAVESVSFSTGKTGIFGCPSFGSIVQTARSSDCATCLYFNTSACLSPGKNAINFFKRG